MQDQQSLVFAQSAVIPWRRRGDTLQVLLITSIRGQRWIIPKGLVEPGMSPAESAAKEAFEEAGIRGRVAPDPLGEYSYRKWGGTCQVLVFLMEVTAVLEQWEEMDVRRRKWLRAYEAAERVREPELQQWLHDLPQLVNPAAGQAEICLARVSAQVP